MINVDMRHYDYFTFGDKDEYGQRKLSTEVKGSILIAIYTTSQTVQDNINYKSAQYIGLTKATVNDSYVINYDNKKLKVLYVTEKGRYKQVFMSEI